MAECTTVASSRTPEEDELELKRTELEAAEAQLAECELELATLAADLKAFETAYLDAIGTRLAKLEELNARVVQVTTGVCDGDPAANRPAEDEALGDDHTHPTGFAPSDELKNLYRRAARAIHPDLAVDAKEQAARTGIMAEVNAAYADGNAERLRQLLGDWSARPEGVTGTDTASMLVKTIRKLAQVKRRLAVAAQQLADFKDSDLYRLKRQVDAASARGKDLLAEMRSTLNDQIQAAENRLARLQRLGKTHV